MHVWRVVWGHCRHHACFGRHHPPSQKEGHSMLHNDYTINNNLINNKQVEYDGQMLMQGTHDGVVIKVISDKVVETAVYHSVQLDPATIRKITAQAEASTGPTNVCNRRREKKKRKRGNTMEQKRFKLINCITVPHLQ